MTVVRGQVGVGGEGITYRLKELGIAAVDGQGIRLRRQPDDPALKSDVLDRDDALVGREQATAQHQVTGAAGGPLYQRSGEPKVGDGKRCLG